MGYNPDEDFFKRVGTQCEPANGDEEGIALILRESGYNIVWCNVCDCYVERVAADSPQRDCNAEECPIIYAGYVIDDDEVDEMLGIRNEPWPEEDLLD